MRYRSKPTEVEAMQWEDTNRITRNAECIVAWVNDNGGEARYGPGTPDHPIKDAAEPRIAVRTINGWACAAPGHYVVMGSATFPVQAHDGLQPVANHLRDFYPCDPETFEQRWEQT